MQLKMYDPLLLIVVLSFTHFFPWQIFSIFNKIYRKLRGLPEKNDLKSNIKKFLNPYDKYSLEKRASQERRLETMELSMKLLHMKFTELPEDTIFQIKKMDQAKLDLLIIEIIESRKIEDITLFNHINQPN